MPIHTLLILLAIGLSAGALGGILGIGGGLIMIPGLVLLLGLDQHTAIGTSLAVMLPPIGIAATTDDESTPPERKAPIGTSETIHRFTASFKR
mgnify:CR=1 FL=1